MTEGPSDYQILRAVIVHLWPDVDTILPLQPVLDELGRAVKGTKAGWSEVRSWCEQNAASLAAVIDPEIGESLDVLVICLDVDIAVEAGIADPPATGSAYDASRLCATVKSWLGASARRLPPEVIIAIPAMSIESWVIASLYPREQHPERLDAPTSWLVERKKLPVGQNGRAIKPIRRYLELGRRVVSRFSAVRLVCREAGRFAEKLERRRDRVQARR